MSDFKGTPGPWQRSPSKESGGSFIEHIDSDYVSHLVAFVHASHGMFEAPIPTEEDAANANLVAAAPDLLEVLQEVQEFAQGWSQYEMPIGLDDRINAAIAKALGEESV